MGLISGLLLGLGLLNCWLACSRPNVVAGIQSEQPPANFLVSWRKRTQDALIGAGWVQVTPRRFVAISALAGLSAFLLVYMTGGSWVLALAFGSCAALSPRSLIQGRARRRQVSLRNIWPDVVDHLVSAIRAGLPLPEALAQLGNRGPIELREPFAKFAADYATSGRFADSLDRLGARLADPVADRLVAALRLTHQVGGTDLGSMLRSLSGLLRADARTRGELEARQSWIVNGARIAVAAPFAVLALLSTRPGTASAFDEPTGVALLLAGSAVCVLAYRVMLRIGRLAPPQRVLR